MFIIKYILLFGLTFTLGLRFCSGNFMWVWAFPYSGAVTAPILGYKPFFSLKWRVTKKISHLRFLSDKKDFAIFRDFGLWGIRRQRPEFIFLARDNSHAILTLNFLFNFSIPIFFFPCVSKWSEENVPSTAVILLLKSLKGKITLQPQSELFFHLCTHSFTHHTWIRHLLYAGHHSGDAETHQNL